MNNFVARNSLILASSFNVQTGSGEIGGSEILSVGNGEKFEYMFFNESVMNMFKYYLPIKVIIVLLLLLCCAMIIMRILGIRSIFQGNAVTNELSHIGDIRTRDLYILKTNHILTFAAKWTKRFGLEISPEQKEYMRYNLERANIKAPGGYRYMTPEEFNGIVKLLESIFLFGGILAFLFFNMFIGSIVIIAVILIFSIMPMLLVRHMVGLKDDLIKNEFPNLYLMLHYELLAGGETPLQTTFRSYGRSTKEPEMIQFVEDCVNIVDTYNVYVGVSHIADRYREIPQVTRLMRLIKQQNEGANIDTELIGFREAILKDQQYRKTQKKEKLVAKARASFNLTMIILVQAVISAMAIYLPDLGIVHF